MTGASARMGKLWDPAPLPSEMTVTTAGPCRVRSYVARQGSRALLGVTGIIHRQRLRGWSSGHVECDDACSEDGRRSLRFPLNQDTSAK